MLSYWTDPRIRFPLHPAYFSRLAERPQRKWVRASPGYEVIEKPGGLVLRLDVPGFGPGDLDVQTEKGVLRIVSRDHEQAPAGASTASPSADTADTAESAVASEAGADETAHTGLRRTVDVQFRIGDDIDVENITGRLLNGLLELELPRKPEARPRRVVVKSAADS